METVSLFFSMLKFPQSYRREVPEEEIQGNPIGMLQELCMMRRWMPPDYTTEQEEGLPHERLFTIKCSVGNFKEYGQFFAVQLILLFVRCENHRTCHIS